MKKKWKWIVGILVLLIAAVGALAAYRFNQSAIIKVQTGKAVRQDLAQIVTASGEIKPRNYVNIGTNANVPSRITEIL
ncbi:MAG: secretion protein HlyD, partial [Bryobacteraceae bacterium]|nr:secretion protein HlyD [Bryobacteraceae bacterium]